MLFRDSVLYLVAHDVEPYRAYMQLSQEYHRLDLRRFARSWNFAVSALHGLVRMRGETLH